MWWYIYLPVILYLQPSEKDILKAFLIYAYLCMFLWCIQIVSPIALTSRIESRLARGRTLAETDFGWSIGKIWLLLIPYYYLVQQWMKKFNYKDFLLSLGFLSFFFLNQNRSILFIAAIVFGIALVRFRSKNKVILLFILAGIAISAIAVTWSHWQALIDETLNQTGDDDYARWGAINYYLFEYSPHWFATIFGNGNISIHTNPALLKFKFKNFYNNNDIGWFGFWSMYGIIPILVIFSMYGKVLFSRKHPFYLKAMIAHTLLPTIWCFWYPDQILLLAVIFYLHACYTEKKHARVQIQPQAEQRKVL
jgi:hypothetical protein